MFFIPLFLTMMVVIFNNILSLIYQPSGIAVLVGVGLLCILFLGIYLLIKQLNKKKWTKKKKRKWHFPN